MEATVVGIDVAKDRLDVCVRPSGERLIIVRTGAGIEDLAERLKKLAPRVVAIEATGGQARTTFPSAPEAIVIVGGGAAGEAAAEMLRREGYSGPITMFSDDDAPPCDRPNLSKDYLAGNAPEKCIPLRPLEFYREQRIELRLRTRPPAAHLSSAARVRTEAITRVEHRVGGGSGKRHHIIPRRCR